jgi:hypothetical protein
MITSLTNLKSTNDAQGRRIHVYATVNGQPTSTTLTYLICDKEYSCPVNGGASRTITISHQETGVCTVVVSDKQNPGAVTTKKLLNLDDAESY